MKKKFLYKMTNLFIVLIMAMVMKSSSFCQVAFQNKVSNSLLNGCEMCYLTFNNQNYLYKCKKYVNCSQAVNKNQEINLNSNKQQNNQKQCSQTTDYTYQATSCLSQCCSYFSSAQKNSKIAYQSSSYCKSAQNIKQVAKIVSVILMVVILIVIVGVTIYCCKYLFKTAHIKKLNMIIQPQINLQSYKIQEQGPYHIQQNEKCAICLQQLCNLYTKCGHYYHPNCFASWIIKQHKCPICITHEFNPVKIYCTKCKIGVKLAIFNSKCNLEQHHIKQYQQIICQFCLKQSICSEQQHVSIIHFQSQQILDQNLEVMNQKTQILNNLSVKKQRKQSIELKFQEEQNIKQVRLDEELRSEDNI